MTSDVIEIEERQHVATIWLNRPDKLNAFNQAMWSALPAAIEKLEQGDTTRVVVIAGRGRSFTAGIDLNDLAGFPVGTDVAERTRLYEEIKRLQGSFSALAASPLPVIAAIHGHCIGAGVDLITAADIRLASADAIFSVRETRLGMIADVGTMQRLPKLIAPGHVAELALTGRDITADDAERIGLVNRVYPDRAALLEAANALADEIAANSPLTTRGIKQVLRTGANRSVDEALDYMALWNAAFLNSNDFAEGIAAAAQRRPPHFDGT
ncbi:MAG: crotonase/enoyl-CoA hydratase family protein [Acidimicrobiia bacterium]